MWKARKLALISLAVCVLEVTILLCIRMFATHPISHSAHSVAIKKLIAATVLLVCDHVGSVSAAKRAQQAGADFIIAQGVEAGGHVAGTVSTMVLVPAS
jgi:NAD(P)H-dependent flavin oxidoreductase YrpB (nitropropane dioxygenase family)